MTNTALTFASVVSSIAFLLTSSAIAEQVFRDDFNDGNHDGWHSMAGEWRVIDGALHQVIPSWDRYIIVRRILFHEGTIRARMRVTNPTELGWGCFGLVLRYPGEAGPSFIRAGAYNHIEVSQPDHESPLGRFNPEVGRVYDLAARVHEGKVTVMLDGKEVGVALLSESETPGYIGFYTENGAAFDDVEVKGDFRAKSFVAEPRSGTPRLELEFAEWRPAHKRPVEAFAMGGSLFLYYRNTGSGDAQFESAWVEGEKITRDQTPDWIGFVRQRPHRIKPGAVGQLQVQVTALPERLGMRLVEHPTEALPVTVEVKPEEGDSIKTQVNLAANTPALQINFMGFSDDLSTIFVYIQNNPAAYRLMGVRPAGPEPKPIQIKTIALGGSNITHRVRWGSRTVAGDVVPVEIPLDKSLTKGSPVVITLTGSDGMRAGHCLRAFPSTFNIVVVAGKNQARADYIQDIHNHGVTAFSGLANYNAHKTLGLEQRDILTFIGRSPSFLHQALTHENTPVTGIIVDEVDKAWGQPVGKLETILARAEEYYREENKYLPLQAWNVINPRSERTGHLSVADAVIHSYGYFMCSATGEGFGRVADLNSREYRMARQPFWPYFRDAEIPVARDTETKTVLPLSKAFQRTLTPKEERWVQFGTIIQGAKSFMHWGYWSIPEEGHYYVKQPCLRIGLGAIAGNRVGPYEIPDKIVRMLKETWDEIGRINAELRIIGPLVARSDVSYLARVISSVPQNNTKGQPAAEAAALVSGLDTIVVIVLNHHLDTGNHPFRATGPISNPNPPRFEPLENVKVELRIPPWLDPRHVLGVDFEGVRTIKHDRQEKKLLFNLAKLEVTRVVVVTSSDAVRDGCLHRSEQARQLLDRMANHKPVANENWHE